MNAPGAGSKDGIQVDGTNAIIKNCDIRNFDRGIVNGPSSIVEIESTTVANHGDGIAGGVPTHKNVVAESNRVGLIFFAQPGRAGNWSLIMPTSVTMPTSIFLYSVKYSARKSLLVGKSSQLSLGLNVEKKPPLKII